MSNPALQKAAIVWKAPKPTAVGIAKPLIAKWTARITTPTISTRMVMSATWPTRRATFLGESGLASSSRTTRSSRNPMRRPIRSAPTVVAVIIPSPPSCMRAARIPCPSGVKSSAGTTAWRPVTVTALTDSKKASSQEMPLLAAGIFSSRVPTRMSPANASTMSRGAESRANTSWVEPARSPAADVDGGASLGIRLRLPQDLVRDGGGVPLPKEQVAEQVHNRVALGPPEIAVRRLVGGVAQVQQQRGDGVGDDRALGTQDLVAADLHALHLQHVLELRGIFYLYLEEEDRLACRDVVVLALLLLLAGVLLGVVAAAPPVGDDVDVALVRRPVYKALGRLVDLYPLLPELEGAVRPGEERDKDYRADEEGCYRDPVGPVIDVGGEGVDEDGGDQAEGKRAAPRPPAVRRQGHSEGRRGHHRQNAGGVGAALGVNIGREDHRDGEGDGGVDKDERPDRASPVGGHAVAGQVAGHDVEEPGHRRGAREPQDRDRGEVIDGAESLAQALVRHVGERAPVRTATLLERLGRDEEGSDEAGGDQVEAHDQGRRGEHLARVADASPGPLGVVSLL